MEHPNSLIDSFTGVFLSKYSGDVNHNISNISLHAGEQGHKTPILHGNVILRGCVVRSTDWVVGVVVNTGKRHCTQYNK